MYDFAIELMHTSPMGHWYMFENSFGLGQRATQQFSIPEPYKYAPPCTHFFISYPTALQLLFVANKRKRNEKMVQANAFSILFFLVH